jgi:hypothetical protein
MARYKNHSLTPPGGWRFRERRSGLWFHHDNYADLVRDVNRHREYKGWNTSTTAQDIDEQICLNLTSDWCSGCEGEPVKDLSQKINMSMAASANRALIAFISNGCQWAPPAEAAARAEVCRTCPYSKHASGCSCQDIYRLIEGLIPKDRRQKAVEQHICMACGCALQAKVNLPMSVVAESLPKDAVFPPWCWQRALKPAQSVADGTESV